MTDIKRILIWGAGAMGAMYGAKFYDMDPASVCFLADGHRYERLLEKGLTVNGRTFHPEAISPSTGAYPFDLIMVALKHHDLVNSLPQLKSFIGTDTIILTVMNGIDSEEIIGRVYGMKHMLYAVALGMDALRENDIVTFTNEGRIIFGEANNRKTNDKVKRVQRFFDRAGITHETPEDMMRPLWWKFMINVGINQTSAVLFASFGVFQQSANARALMEAAMREVTAVAQACNVKLGEKDIEQWYPVLEKLSATGKTSMLQDIEAGRKTEVEIFAGKIVSLGKKHGIATPVNETLLRIISVFEERGEIK